MPPKFGAFLLNKILIFGQKKEGNIQWPCTVYAVIWFLWMEGNACSHLSLWETLCPYTCFGKKNNSTASLWHLAQGFIQRALLADIQRDWRASSFLCHVVFTPFQCSFLFGVYLYPPFLSSYSFPFSNRLLFLSKNLNYSKLCKFGLLILLVCSLVSPIFSFLLIRLIGRGFFLTSPFGNLKLPQSL